ncbi:MAG: hypothetical protein Rubg2KO_34730 [Rubricoccaceae bacterium]
MPGCNPTRATGLHQRTLISRVRPLLLVFLSLALAACVGESEPDSFTLRPTTSAPDSLLARLDVDELAEAFERLREAGYTAEVSVDTVESDIVLPEEVEFRQTVEVHRSEVRVLSQSGPGTPFDADQPFVVFDPVARLLPKEPPFQNPAVREMYAVAREETSERLASRGSVASATATREEGSDPITRANVSVDTTTGQVVWANVFRESRSAVFRERSQAIIGMTWHDGAWWPAFGQLLTDTDVPLADNYKLFLEWRVLSIGGVELTADTSSTL